ncbi:hypothetical protein FQN60_009612 [Etheostoma spectabile]|uniref:Uncharacterized protein n=1 Tax=Etheostoma spectabile TaxID=54343 RepID=A0A5J5DJC0_9PERO|nr:hypothetical protein FQN60_009612 [Etheostoma spectabile]
MRPIILLLDDTGRPLGRDMLVLPLLRGALRPLGFGVTLVRFSPVAAVSVCVAAALLPHRKRVSPLNDRNAVLSGALVSPLRLSSGFLQFLRRLSVGLVWVPAALMIQNFSRYLLDVADDMGRSQVLAAFLAGQIVEDLLCTQVKAGAEHLTALCAVTSMFTWSIGITRLKIRDDFLLLLLQDTTQGFHMLESEFQHHGFLQMTQRLKQEDLR